MLPIANTRSHSALSSGPGPRRPIGRARAGPDKGRSSHVAVDPAAASWVRYQLSMELSGVHLSAGGQHSVNVLKNSCSESRNKVLEILDDQRLAHLLKTKREEIDKEWDKKIWVEEFPGRDILKRFVGKHAGKINYKSFANLVGNKISGLPAEENPLAKVIAPILS